MLINTSLIILSIFVYFLIFYFRKQISTLFNVYDVSDEKRKIHKFPTPKTASYALAFLFFTLIIFNYFYKLFEKDMNLVLMGTLTIFLIGFLDDKYKLSAISKTILISLTTLILCFLSENLVIGKFYIYTFDFFFVLGNFSLIFTILSVLCLTNSLNLADGINGLATGIVFFWLIYINQIFENNIELITNIIFINLVLIFVHNIKGKHFLGDAGSLMLSSFLAYFIILLNNQATNDPGHQKSAETILILFIFPVIDMIRLFFERLINKKKVAVGDKNHFHHHLIEKYNISKALIIYFLLINIPIMLSLYTNINKIIIILLIFIMYFSILYNIKKNMNNFNKKKLINLVFKLLTILILSIIISLFITKKGDDVLKVRIKSAPNTLLSYNLSMADVLLTKLLVKPEASKSTYEVIAQNLRPTELKVQRQISYLTKLELSENLVFMQFKNKDINNDSAILEVMNLINTEIEQDIHKLVDRYYNLGIEKKRNFNQMKINKLSALLSTYRNRKGEIDYETINSADVDSITSTILQSIEGSNKKSLIDDSYSQFFQDFSSKYNDLLFLHKPNIEIALEQLNSYNPEKDDFIILELARLLDKAKIEKFFVNYEVQKTLSNKPSLYVSSLGIFILLIITYFLIIFLKQKVFSKHLKKKISSLLDLR